MSTTAIPAGRMSLPRVAGPQFAAMQALERSVELDPAVKHLVKIRASQINGCAFCLDMHVKEAAVAGERDDRLHLLPVWRESPVYDEREQAALELCEAMTLLTDGHVPDPVWERAAAAFDERELAQLVFAITTINAWNRLMVATRVEPGHYRPAGAPAATVAG